MPASLPTHLDVDVLAQDLGVSSDALLSRVRFPTGTQYVEETTAALSALGFDSDFVRDNLVAPVQSHVNGLITAVEVTANSSLTDLHSLIANASAATGLSTEQVVQIAADVGNMLLALVDGDVEIATQKGIETATTVGSSVAQKLELASEVLNVIPVVGSMVSSVVSTIFQFANLAPSSEEKELLDERARAQLDNALKSGCPQQVQRFTPTPTSAEGKATPSDLFRTVYVAAQLGTFLPPTLGALYVLLCGGESQGVGFTRYEYGRWLARVRAMPGLESIGIEPDVQRRMWGCIKAIMLGTRDPSLAAGYGKTGDSGRAMFGVLQDLVLGQYGKGWNERSLEQLAAVLGNRWGSSMVYSADLGYAVAATGSCGSMTGLHYHFLASVSQWQAQLRDNFCSDFAATADALGRGCQRYRPTPTAVQLQALRAKTKKGTLVLNQQGLRQLVDGVGGGMTSTTKAVVASTAVAGAFAAANSLGWLKRLW